ncbi:hypothetical protein P3X46_013763 [Hevea brasiliensis]|uniref:Uncharacterized protein n=1 Tax=Hevea brasiliensis TaxID=3981 RepID=A0ABQ9M4L9_HEVBR|nr:hypothetical protein P3X46_013763 [Hevea brasiliensis]
MVGFGVADFWRAHSKPGVELSDSSESLGHIVHREEGTA